MVQGLSEAIGSVTEVQGGGQIVHADGSTEPLAMGAEIFQGDRIETLDGGSASLTFTDESSFAVSSNSSLVIDEYVFDGGTEAGVQDFNMMKGMFVYTSGLIGRDDPDDVHIKTPVGSIGIRGTIIAGDVDSGQITVVEGAIVLKDFNGQEVTLANQYETARFGTEGNGITHLGEISGADLMEHFKGLSGVSAGLFSNIQDSITDGAQQNVPQPADEVQGTTDDRVELQDGVPEDAPLQVEEDISAMVEDRVAQPVQATANEIILNNPFLSTHGQELQYFLDHGGDVVKWSNGKVAGFNHAGQMMGAMSNGQQEMFFNPYGRAPVYVGNDLPQNYWTASNTMAFSHGFSGEFKDMDALINGDSLTYAISSVSHDNIVTMTADNALTGRATFNFSSITSDTDVTFTVQATDLAGNTASRTYTLHVVAQDGVNDVVLTTSSQTVTQSNQGIFDTNNINNLTVADNAHHNVAFMGNGDDQVTIYGDNNTVYAGSGTNTTTFGANAEGNVSYGENGRDTFIFNNVNNQAYGFGNNDTFQMDINLLHDLENVNNSFFRIRGADDAQGFPVNRDKLELTGMLSNPNDILDFTKINNNYIRGIETIDIANNGISDHIRLNLSDVFNMTNANDHVLKINANGGASTQDIVDIIGMSQDEHSALAGYDQFSGMFNGESVTLYVQNTAEVNIL